MKRRFLTALLLLFCVGFSLVSCSAAPDPVGRWEIVIEDEELGEVRMVYHFTSEGEINLEQKKGDEIPFSIPFGTYVTDGEHLTIFSDGKESGYTFSVTDSNLTLLQEGQEALVFNRV
ncbi:MAG: hypothetical protein IKJ74_02805 [Clostridia bacterium]|nr:hypothetical protein [Clostridia bacterium]